MAQIAKTGTEQAPTPAAKPATGNGAEQAKPTADQAAAATREATDRVEDVARRSLHLVGRTAGAVGEAQREVVQRSAEGTAELGRALAELAEQQTRHNLEALQALTGAVAWDRVARAVDWQQVLRIQADYLRASLERTARLTQRYLEVSQAVMAAAASAAQDQAKKAV